MCTVVNLHAVVLLLRYLDFSHNTCPSPPPQKKSYPLTIFVHLCVFSSVII